MRLHGDFICTAQLRRPAALESYASFVIKFFAIHQKHGTRSMGKRLLAKDHIAKLNKLTK
jgi:hypothetical protein